MTEERRPWQDVEWAELSLVELAKLTLEERRDYIYGRRIKELEAESAEISAHRDRLNKILRTLEGSELAGSCDWGFCDREADGWRRADDFGDFLPVCAQHMEAYERIGEQNAALVAEIAELKERLGNAFDFPNHNALASVEGEQG